MWSSINFISPAFASKLVRKHPPLVLRPTRISSVTEDLAANPNRMTNDHWIITTTFMRGRKVFLLFFPKRFINGGMVFLSAGWHDNEIIINQLCLLSRWLLDYCMLPITAFKHSFIYLFSERYFWMVYLIRSAEVIDVEAFNCCTWITIQRDGSRYNGMGNNTTGFTIQRDGSQYNGMGNNTTGWVTIQRDG